MTHRHRHLGKSLSRLLALPCFALPCCRTGLWPEWISDSSTTTLPLSLPPPLRTKRFVVLKYWILNFWRSFKTWGLGRLCEIPCWWIPFNIRPFYAVCIYIESTGILQVATAKSVETNRGQVEGKRETNSRFTFSFNNSVQQLVGTG